MGPPNWLGLTVVAYNASIFYILGRYIKLIIYCLQLFYFNVQHYYIIVLFAIWLSTVEGVTTDEAVG